MRAVTIHFDDGEGGGAVVGSEFAEVSVRFDLDGNAPRLRLEDLRSGRTRYLDALELASKVGVPDPVSALDWPELRVRAIVPQPGDEPLLLLFVGWPEHPQRAATLLLAIDSGDNRSVPLLSLWCATQASVSPTRRDGAGLELRRRQSLERVHAVLIAEDYMVLRPAAFPVRPASPSRPLCR